MQTVHFSQNRWECMVSKTVYFALSFHEEHRKSQPPRRTYHHSSYELHGTMDLRARCEQKLL